MWDNGTIGNYWSDYGGVDANDDGIGDTPYFINGTAGSQDLFPIWEDGDDLPPDIRIIEPNSNQLFSYNAPNFNVEISDANLDSMWYSIDNGVSNYTFFTNGTINQAAWELKSNGTVNIQFYANDTLGHLGSDEVIVRKDVIAPTILIISPSPDDLFGITAPSFNVSVSDANLYSMWYTLDGGVTNTTFVTNETIDQALWDALPDGNVTMGFYTNDSVGNSNYAEVIIRKDVTVPTILIISPSPDDLFGITAPSFIVSVSGANIDSVWYTLDGGLTNTTFVTNGTVDQALWDALLEGDIIFNFYVNNTLGRINTAEVIIRKDVTVPTIRIISPSPDDLFGITAPNFNVEISDANLDSMWYTLDGGLTNTTFATNGTIDQALWDALPDGNVTMGFYTNDTLGYSNYTEVTVRKDVEAPQIIINSPPSSEIFANFAPAFSLNILEANLDSTWYTIDGGITNITFFGFSGGIDQVEWNKKGTGSVIIRFYANDTVGNLGSNGVSVQKSIGYLPLIPLIIDDTGLGDFTWAQAALQGWCGGSGTWNNPYIIEYVIINGQNSGSCIEIRNSNLPFVIRNCIMSFSGNESFDAGIKSCQ